MLPQIQNSSKKPLPHCFWSNIRIYFRRLRGTTLTLTLFLFAGTLRNWAYCCCFGRIPSLKIRIKFDHEDGNEHCFSPKQQQHTPITIGVTSQKQAKNLYRKFSFQIKEKSVSHVQNRKYNFTCTSVRNVFPIPMGAWYKARVCRR
jgi:hypothetical protein